MRRGVMIHLVMLSIGLAIIPGAGAQENQQRPRPLDEYFRAEVGRIAARPLLGITSGEEWKDRRGELQRQLRSMLGIEPLPPRTELMVECRGVIERDEFVIEKLLFQSMPGLYVTANLYRPRVIEPGQKLPGVLYVCGHAKVERDGVIYGNKAHYQPHGAWFAANGYVCLVVDSLQLGEVPGVHHGTYREGRWWWQSRGYTPAGVETFNGMRAVDLLASRPEVDSERLGVTGRSGGGIMSWWMGALDDRLKVVVPVAGITDLADQVYEPWPPGKYPAGVIEGHCDCMFFVNTHRWDFDTVAALCAPKALQVQNTVADPIFPEPGVMRIYAELVRVYNWYDARHQLDLVIGQGGHEDTEELRHQAFAFFERHLKENPIPLADITEPDRSVPIEELKVLDVGETLADSRNASIDETFVPAAAPPELPENMVDWMIMKEKLGARGGSFVYRGLPSGQQTAIDVRRRCSHDRDGLNFTSWDLGNSSSLLRAWALRPGGAQEPRRQVVHVCDQKDWDERWGPLTEALESNDAERLASSALHQELAAQVRDGATVNLIVPRWIGPTAWDSKYDVHIRRRFALLGQTPDGLRAWDVMRALDAVELTERPEGSELELVGRGDAAAWCVWAALFDERVNALRLEELPPTVRQGPAFLGLEQVLDMPQAVALLYPKRVTIQGGDPSAWDWCRQLFQRIAPDSDWPTRTDD